MGSGYLLILLIEAKSKINNLQIPISPSHSLPIFYDIVNSGDSHQKTPNLLFAQKDKQTEPARRQAMVTYGLN